MKKAVLFGIVAAAFGLLASQHSLAAGSKLECDIVKVENNIVTLDCGTKAKKKLHAGKKAIVREKTEGC